MLKENILILYTDGSCLENPGGASGWCCCLIEGQRAKNLVYPDGGDLWILSGGEISSTNNRMELTAVNEALAMCEGGECIIYTDSKLTLNCAKGLWKRKSNLDLWDIFDVCSKNINIQWEWVKSHSTNDINNLVDEIARNEAKMIKNKNKNIVQ